MYSLFALLFVLLQTAAVLGSFFAQATPIFYNVLVYGSPLYLFMTLLKSESAFFDTNPFYLGMMAFHIIKYLLIFRSQWIDDRNWKRTIAIVLEACYLAGAAYYLYF